MKRNTAKILKSKTFYFLLFTLYFPCLWPGEPTTFKDLQLSSRQKKALLNGDFIIDSTVKTLRARNEKKGDLGEQTLDYTIIGLHPRPCSIALRRLTLYENYHEYLSFVQESSYLLDEQRINLLLGHRLLPFDMGLNFILPKMEGPGVFPLLFDRGFLAGLSGAIEISEHDNRCLFYAHAAWQGPHSGIGDTLFSLFSTTLSRMAMSSLFRASMTP